MHKGGAVSAPRLDAVEVATADEIELAIILLHGLGADGHDFAPIVPELALPCGVRFVFPHAPERPITINGGLRMRAWYDIIALDRSGPEDEAGVRASAAAVGAFVDREIERGLPSERIVLAGFSQGGAVALHAALREPRPLGGVLALSTYLPLAATLPSERAEANAATPIFLAHGSGDPMIPVELAERSRDLLTAAGHRVEWHVYPVGHTVCAEEVVEVGAWLSRIALG